MAPLCQVFHAEELPHRVNTIQHNFKDKRRKGPAVNLKECQLLEMVQYSCNPPSEGIPQPGVVRCQPITRLFRRCAKGLMVETTTWEPIRIAAEESQKKATDKKS